MLLLSHLALTFPLFAGLVGEIPAGPPIDSRAPGEQTGARVASDGDRFLAVWIDHRDSSGAENLYAARLDSNGKVLDPTDIRIPLPHGVSRIIIAVLWMRDTWTVLWSERDFRSDTPVPKSNVLVARIDSAGRLLEPPRAAIEDAYATAWRSAATNGSRILVAYGDKYALLDDHAMLLQRDLPLPAQASTVASNGSDFMIEARGTFISVSANGDVEGIAAGLIASNDIVLGLASDGADYLAVTRNFNSGQFSTHHLGAAAQSSQAPVPLPAIPGIPTSGDLIWSGSAYTLGVVTTIDTSGSAYQQAFGLRIDRRGTPIDADPFPIAGHATTYTTVPASIASNGRDLVSVWHALSADSGNDTYASIVNATSLQQSDAILLSQSANQQVNPSIAFSGQNFLVLWQETTGTYIGRIGLNGEALDGRGLRITPAGYNPKVIFDGSNYLVGWVTAGNNLAILWMTRITPEGQILDGDGVAIASSSCVFNFDMASNGDRTLVVWDSCGYEAVRAVQLDRSARPIGIPTVITPKTMQTANPTVAWNGSEYLIAFQEQIEVPSPLLCPGCKAFRSNVRGVRISSGLTVLDTEPLALAVSDSEDQKNPLTASNGKDFLVGWTGPEIRARSIAADGTLGATLNLGGGMLSSLIFDGIRYALGYAANGDCFAQRLATADRAVISATPDVESSPRLVAVGGSNIAAAYVRIATEPLYGGVARVFVRDVNMQSRSRAVRAR